MTFDPLYFCRICQNDHLQPILDLGIQAMTGIFPATAKADADLERGPLELVRCSHCGLVQLSGTYSLTEMYGDNYGYRSGLNAGMAQHLRRIASSLSPWVGRDELVIDIGSNDGTLLNAYPTNTRRVGFDPTCEKFAQFYRPDVARVQSFFTKEAFRSILGGQQAKVVTSISMFYDLPDPNAFVEDVAHVLHRDGVWFFEQSYLPSMLAANAYDTVCHEHLEYYGLKQIKQLLDQNGLVITSVNLNDVNGGSIALTAMHRECSHAREAPAVAPLCLLEDAGMERALASLQSFVTEHRRAFLERLVTYKVEGKLVCALGASTKGNVLLQACGATSELIAAIGEVNPDKFGKMTPGTRIPIVSEEELFAMKPDVCVVLPWHFRESFLRRRKPGGPTLLFPLPNMEVCL